MKVAFTPADTGAEEWIQYRIQKLVGEDYQEYDPVQDTTGSEISWKDSLIGQAEETIRLDKEGTYRVIVRTKDSMDRVSAESMTTSTVRIDMTAPTITEITEKKDKWESAAESFLNMLTGGAYFKDHITYTFDSRMRRNGWMPIKGKSISKRTSTESCSHAAWTMQEMHPIRFSLTVFRWMRHYQA